MTDSVNASAREAWSGPAEAEDVPAGVPIVFEISLVTSNEVNFKSYNPQERRNFCRNPRFHPSSSSTSVPARDRPGAKDPGEYSGSPEFILCRTKIPKKNPVPVFTRRAAGFFHNPRVLFSVIAEFGTRGMFTRNFFCEPKKPFSRCKK